MSKFSPWLEIRVLNATTDLNHLVFLESSIIPHFLGGRNQRHYSLQCQNAMFFFLVNWFCHHHLKVQESLEIHEKSPRSLSRSASETRAFPASDVERHKRLTRLRRTLENTKAFGNPVIWFVSGCSIEASFFGHVFSLCFYNTSRNVRKLALCQGQMTELQENSV